MIRENLFNCIYCRFISLFRLNKDAFLFVLNEIKPKLRRSRRTTSIPPEIKLAAALRFFAQGSYQLGVGEDFLIGLAQQTISTVLQEVSSAIEDSLCHKMVKLEMSLALSHNKKH